MLEVLNFQNKNNNYINNKIHYNELKDGGCKEICDFLFDHNLVSSKVKRYKSELYELKSKNEEYEKCIADKNEIIKKLSCSDIRLKEIENSKSWILIEKMRKIRNEVLKK